mmetsp:Transcript_11697/g.17745  ORF Transcript_11697/g.17745 Transcript_11697/m.17745 type:complete len:351 (-) Transcript_11697:38-1090(-)
MCYMTNKLMAHLCAKAEANPKAGREKKSINIDYADNLCNMLFAHRNNKELEARIRFLIQDVIDIYNKEWRHTIADIKNKHADSEGFKQVYIPKDQILTEEQVFKNGKRGDDWKTQKESNRGGRQQKYFYRAKSPKKEEPVEEEQPAKQGKGNNKMAGLLQGLMPDTEYNKFLGHENNDDDDDEDANDFVERRMSMNQINRVEVNFQKYMDQKPAAGVRREILNMFNEYKESGDHTHAKEELISICNQYDIEKYSFVGYFLNNALAEKPEDFRGYLDLVFNYFHKEQNLVSAGELRESVNICVANLPDLIIDYPKAREYAKEIIGKAVEFELFPEADAEKYCQHIDNLESF